MPQETTQSSSMIVVGAGPEDMVLDETDNRLLVSCDARRESESPRAEIYAIDLATDRAAVLPRTNEPTDLVFHPHGIDLWIGSFGERRLSVISHDDEAEKHAVIQYTVTDKALVFERIIWSPLLNSPNSVVSLANGSLLVTNDSGKRGSRMEALLKKKRSTIIHLPLKGEAVVAAKKLAYANGITRDDDFVYVTTTRQHTVFRYRFGDGQLIDRAEVCEIKGGDNLRWDGTHLLTTSHPKAYAFVKHVKKSSNKSPSVVYRIDPSDGGRKILYANDGREISGASTAIIHGGNLYISQVFDPFVLKVKL